MKPKTHQAATIKAADIAALAGESRARALAAREAATELTAEQVDAVSGGAAGIETIYDRPFPWGVLPFWKMADVINSPTDRMTIPADIGSVKGF